MSEPISVVIPAKDSAETIGEQLSSLVNQSWPYGGEVIVVDNGSYDGTARIAQSFASPELPVVVLSCGDVAGAGYARNCGAEAARFARLGFCDSDDIVGDRWVEQLGRALDRADAVGGAIDLTRLNSDASQRSRGSWNVSALPLLEGEVPVLSSCNFGISTEVFHGVGGFSTSIGPAEDCELSVRLHQAGVAAMFAPEAVVHYRMRATIRTVFAQAYRWGRRDPQIVRAINPDSTSLRPARILRSWVWALRSPHLLATEAGRFRYAYNLGKRIGFLSGLTRSSFGEVTVR